MQTIYLPDFIEALKDVLYSEKLIQEHPDGDQVRTVPVEVVFKSMDGTPVQFPLTAIGVRTDDDGLPVSLVMTTFQKGEIQGATYETPKLNG